MADRHRESNQAGDTRRQDVHPVSPRLAEAPGRAALRCSIDCARRLPGAAQLLHWLCARARGEIDLTIERIEDGEVSSYMHDVLVVGDLVEVRGPIGGYFVWEAALGGPLLLVAGGSGVVPLMAMIRHRRAAGSAVPTHLLYSSRTAEGIIYRRELETLQAEGSGLRVFHTLTREHPDGWTGYTRRIDVRLLLDVAGPLGPQPLVYVCGPTLLVEAVAGNLQAAGVDPGRIRTERFGPTGAS